MRRGDIGPKSYVQQCNDLPIFFGAMDIPADLSRPASGVKSKILPGPPFLRHYPDYHLIAWRPEGILDDNLLDQIADWLVEIEMESPHFKRFIDFSRLKEIAVRTSHVFEIAPAAHQ